MRNEGEKFVLGASKVLGSFARRPLADEQFFALGLRLLELGDVGGDAANGVRPLALVAERELDRNKVVRPIDGDDSLFELKRRISRNYRLIVGA